MKDILAVDGKKIDKIRSDMAKLISYLGRNSKKSKIEERLIKKIKVIHNEIEDLVIQARLKKNLATKV